MDDVRPDYITDDFVREFHECLTRDGFVSDEHGIHPPGSEMNSHIEWIRDALREAGHSWALSTGHVQGNDDVGFVYFIFDEGRYATAKDAGRAVLERLTGHSSGRG